MKLTDRFFEGACSMGRALENICPIALPSSSAIRNLALLCLGISSASCGESTNPPRYMGEIDVDNHGQITYIDKASNGVWVSDYLLQDHPLPTFACGGTGEDIERYEENTAELSEALMSSQGPLYSGDYAETYYDKYTVGISGGGGFDLSGSDDVMQIGGEYIDYFAKWVLSEEQSAPVSIQAVCDDDGSTEISLEEFINCANTDKEAVAINSDMMQLICSVYSPAGYAGWQYLQYYPQIDEDSKCIDSDFICAGLNSMLRYEELLGAVCPERLNISEDDWQDLSGDVHELHQDLSCEEAEKPDADSDSVPDFVDNCVEIANLDQLDTDRDGVGDLCQKEEVLPSPEPTPPGPTPDTTPQETPENTPDDVTSTPVTITPEPTPDATEKPDDSPTPAVTPVVTPQDTPIEPPVTNSSDLDGDGYESDDCDDGNATVYPGAMEVYDGLDNDCDEEIDENQILVDRGEGYAQYTGLNLAEVYKKGDDLVVGFRGNGVGPLQSVGSVVVLAQGYFEDTISVVLNNGDTNILVPNIFDDGGFHSVTVKWENSELNWQIYLDDMFYDYGEPYTKAPKVYAGDTVTLGAETGIGYTWDDGIGSGDFARICLATSLTACDNLPFNPGELGSSDRSGLFLVDYFDGALSNLSTMMPTYSLVPGVELAIIGGMTVDPEGDDLSQF